MYFSKILGILSLAAAATAQTVSYDTSYDDASASLDTVACSNGANGLMTRYGWQTFGQVARFPYIGGVEAVTGWNSANCGTCWSATYDGTTIYVLAIDVALEGINVSEEAMNALTGGNAVEFGRVTATIEQVDVSYCGL